MAIITEFNKWYLSCDSYTTPQIWASCIKAALGNDAHFRPLTEKEGILFQQQQELEAVAHSIFDIKHGGWLITFFGWNWPKTQRTGCVFMKYRQFPRDVFLQNIILEILRKITEGVRYEQKGKE